MKEEIYGWMKNLAVYYIFLTGIMNFIPDEKYARYIRCFTGLLLILLLCSPVFQIFELNGSVLENFRKEWFQSKSELLQTGDQEQKQYLLSAYEKEIGIQIEGDLEEKGYYADRIQVVLEEDGSAIWHVYLYMEGEQNSLGEEEIADDLEKKYGLGRERISFFHSQNGETAVADSASGWSASGDHRDAG